MNIKELAEQAGFTWSDPYDFWAAYEYEIERFAELVRQDEREKCSEDYLADCVAAVEAARLEEREACANLSDEFDDDVGQAISKAIRGRQA